MTVCLTYLKSFFLSPPAGLQAKIEKVNTNDPKSLSSLLIDLTNCPHPSLEGQLRSKTSQISKKNFDAMLDEALKNDKVSPKNLLETCMQVFDYPSLKKQFNVLDDLPAIARNEVDYTPVPSSSLYKMADPLMAYGQSHLPTVWRVFVYTLFFPATVIQAVIQSTWDILESASAPKASKKGDKHHSHSNDISKSEILNLMPNLRANFILLAGYAWAINNYYLNNSYLNRYLDLATFPQRKNYALAVTTGVYAITYYVCRNIFKLTTMSETFDEKKLFTNLNDQAIAGIIQPGRSRLQEMEELAISLKHQRGFDVKIPFITGPTGVGKTKFIKDFAWRCAKDNTFTHYGKTVFLINTAMLLEKPKLLSNILNAIKDPSKVILFFDEAHTAGETEHAQKHSGSSGTRLLQLLKTEILKHTILCVMATTDEEYKKCIQHDKAFVSRLVNISLPEMGSDEVQHLLKEHVQNYLSAIVKVTQKGYEAIVTIAKTRPDCKDLFEPRKSLKILEMAISKAQIWNPTQLRIDLQKERDIERDLLMECRENSDADPYWSSSPKGIATQRKLKESQKKIKDLETVKLQQRTDAYKTIQALQSLFSQYVTEKAHLVHEVATNTSQESEKRYFFTKFVAVPALDRLLKTKVEAFNTNSAEKICFKIDETFVNSVFASK